MSGAVAGGLTRLGSLLAPDANGLRLPGGFTSRVIARSAHPVIPGGRYDWHGAPDGGGVFSTSDGGWVYVSNSELKDAQGGVGVIRFDANAEIVDAYSVLNGTNRNCSGGVTPWGTWLSCEEVTKGLVWECDPFGRDPSVPRPALGMFSHEAAAVDPATHQIYLTEDREDGLFYRFTPKQRGADGRMNLSSGLLEAAEIMSPETGAVVWHPVPDPSAGSEKLRYQLPGRTTPFNRGEGICYQSGNFYFTTTGDDRIWFFDPGAQRIGLYYVAGDDIIPRLRGVDNLVSGQDGSVLVAEDGKNMRIAAIYPEGVSAVIVQVTGQDASEVAGLAFSPDGKRLYFSSQRGVTGKSRDGITYEVTGPFFG